MQSKIVLFSRKFITTGANYANKLFPHKKIHTNIDNYYYSRWGTGFCICFLGRSCVNNEIIYFMTKTSEILWFHNCVYIIHSVEIQMAIGNKTHKISWILCEPHKRTVEQVIVQLLKVLPPFLSPHSLTQTSSIAQIIIKIERLIWI